MPINYSILYGIRGAKPQKYLFNKYQYDNTDNKYHAVYITSITQIRTRYVLLTYVPGTYYSHTIVRINTSIL